MTTLVTLFYILKDVLANEKTLYSEMISKEELSWQYQPKWSKSYVKKQVQV